MQTPNYDALMDSVEKSGLEIARNPLKAKDGRYELDFDGLEPLLADPRTKVMLMANPNNPTGRLWTEKELRRLGELCLAHKVMILTDDIHCDFAMAGHRYVPLPSLSPELAEHTVLFTSTNKTFNLGGLQTATVVIGDAELRERYCGAMLRYQTRLDNLFGAIALETAYEKCGYWLDEVPLLCGGEPAGVGGICVGTSAGPKAVPYGRDLFCMDRFQRSWQGRGAGGLPSEGVRRGLYAGTGVRSRLRSVHAGQSGLPEGDYAGGVPTDRNGTGKNENRRESLPSGEGLPPVLHFGRDLCGVQDSHPDCKTKGAIL